VIEEEQEQELVPCRRARTSPSAKQRGSELGGGWENLGGGTFSRWCVRGEDGESDFSGRRDARPDVVEGREK
jgi:hypothetical protein